MSIYTLRTLVGLKNGPDVPVEPWPRMLRGALGLGIAVLGLVLVLMTVGSWVFAAMHDIANDPNKWMGVRNSAIAGAVTGVGALALLVMNKIDDLGLGCFIAVAAGMMAAAAWVSLLMPALLMPQVSAWVWGALLAGYGLMAVLDSLLPHEHPCPSETLPRTRRLHMASLMVVAISIHNLPEGFAVGASIGQAGAGSMGTALSIGLQNIPEGFIVSTALWSIGVRKGIAALVAFATGLVEPVGACVGVLSVHAWPEGAPLSMSFAAGAMAFVVLNEMLPEGAHMIGKLKTMYIAGLSTVLTALALGWMGA